MLRSFDVDPSPVTSRSNTNWYCNAFAITQSYKLIFHVDFDGFGS